MPMNAFPVKVFLKIPYTWGGNRRIAKNRPKTYKKSEQI